MDSKEFVFNHPALPKALCVWFSENYLHPVDVYLWLVATRNALLPVPQGYERNFLFEISRRGHEHLIRWFQRHDKIPKSYDGFTNYVCCGLAAGEHFWILKRWKTPAVCRNPEVVGVALAAVRDVKVIDQLKEMGFIVESPVLRYITMNSDLETLQKLCQKYGWLGRIFYVDYFMTPIEHHAEQIEKWWRGDFYYSQDKFIEDCLEYADDDYCCYVVEQCRPQLLGCKWFFEKLAKKDRRAVIQHFYDDDNMLSAIFKYGTLKTYQALQQRKTHNMKIIMEREIFFCRCDAIEKFEWLVNDLGVEINYYSFNAGGVRSGYNKELLKHIILKGYCNNINLLFRHEFLLDSELRPIILRKTSVLTMLFDEFTILLLMFIVLIAFFGFAWFLHR